MELKDNSSPPLPETIINPMSFSRLETWLNSPCGQLLQQEEQAVLDEILPGLFGYHLMQISINERVDFGGHSPIHHRFSVLGLCGDPTTGEIKRSYISASFDALPLECDSVDVVILHHVLEFSPNPHQILKEINRVLIPRGHVIIVGFNPFSLMGLWRGIISRISRQPQWHYSALTKWRLQDWFKFLDLNRTQIRDTFYRPPCSSALLLNRFAFLDALGKRLRLPLGGAYVMVARKDVNAVTPIRASWEKFSRRLPNLAATRPATPRSYSVDNNPQKKQFLH